MVRSFKMMFVGVILAALVGVAVLSVFPADAQDREQPDVIHACLNITNNQIRVLRALRDSCAAAEIPIFLSTSLEGALPPIFEGDVQLIPGPQGSPGETGPAGSQGPQGPAGPQGPGGTGPAGPQGQPGPIGATGPQGPQGPAGAVGPTGAPGMSCWDTNGNGGADYYEDTNGDGVVNALDCQGPMGLTGPQGMVGPTGPAGAPGVSCWDVNGNSVAEASEDTNGDYYVNALDCQGPTGAQGNTGAQGPQGPRGLQGPVGAPGMSAATAVEVFRLGEVSISQTGFSVPLSGWYFTRSTKNIDFMLQIQSNLATDCWLAKVDLRLMRDGLAVQTIDGITLNILRNQEYVILFDGGNLLAATHSFDVEVRFERLSGRTDCTVTVDGLVSLAQFQGY